MEFLITEANINDIDEIINLKQDIWNKMENKDWYIINGTNKEFLENQLRNNGLILKAVSNNKIIGFLIVKNNIEQDNQILKEINLENEFSSCIELSNAGVDYRYRENNLQTLMIETAEEIMINKYNIKYILSTVHPDNTPSIKSLLKLDYKVACKTKLYGNKDRCILIKQLDM